MRNHQLIHKNTNVCFLRKTKKLNKELLESKERSKQSRLKLINVSLKNKRKHVFKDKKRLLNMKKSSKLKLDKLKSWSVKLIC